MSKTATARRRRLPAGMGDSTVATIRKAQDEAIGLLGKLNRGIAAIERRALQCDLRLIIASMARSVRRLLWGVYHYRVPSMAECEARKYYASAQPATSAAGIITACCGTEALLALTLEQCTGYIDPLGFEVDPALTGESAILTAFPIAWPSASLCEPRLQNFRRLMALLKALMGVAEDGPWDTFIADTAMGQPTPTV